MLASLAAYAMVASRTPLEATVDFSCLASRAEVALKQLSERVGETLRADPSTAADILVLQVHGIPVQQLLGKIAEAAHAVWMPHAGALYLSRSPDQDRTCHRLMAAEYAARLRKALDKLSALPGNQAEWTPDVARDLAADTESAMSRFTGLPDSLAAIAALRGRSPASRVLMRLLSAIGPDAMADRISDPSVAYATSPTAMQIGIPASDDVLSDFLAEQRTFVDATKAFAARKADSNAYMIVPGVNRGSYEPGGDPHRGIGKSLIRLRGGYDDENLSVNMTITDGGGRVLTRANPSLQLEPRARPTFDPVGDNLPTAPEPLAIELRDASSIGQSKTIYSASMMQSSAGKTVLITLSPPMPVRRRRLSDALAAWLRSPSVNEPFRLTLGPVLTAIAQRRSDNLVADLDDRSFSLYEHPKRRPSDWLGSRDLQDWQDVREEHGWLSVSLRDPGGARKARISRAGLGELMAAFARRPVVTLSEVCRFAQTQSEAPGEGIDSAYIRAACPYATFMPNVDSLRWPVYRLFGALTDLQRTAIAQGKTLDVVSLPTAASEALRRLIFESDFEPTLKDRDGMDINSQ